MTNNEAAREHILRIAAQRFVAHPFAVVSLTDIADDADIAQDLVASFFPDTRAAAVAVLDHERESMHRVQRVLAESDRRYLDRIVQAFRMVGENLVNDVVVRGGVCLASGSRTHFPERRLDPFGTWLGYIEQLLTAARDTGELREAVDPGSIARVVVAAGMGTMDFARTQDRWSEVGHRLEQTAQTIIDAIIAPSDESLQVPA
jgi:AcrR family transcriptional regulator